MQDKKKINKNKLDINIFKQKLGENFQISVH